jgi:hypothetical protein
LCCRRKVALQKKVAFWEDVLAQSNVADRPTLTLCHAPKVGPLWRASNQLTMSACSRVKQVSTIFLPMLNIVCLVWPDVQEWKIISTIYMYIFVHM